MARLLLDRAAHTEQPAHRTRAPLACAAQGGHESAVRLLLDRGAVFETEGQDTGLTPLCLAAGHGHEAVMRQVLDKGADVESRRGNLRGHRPKAWTAMRSRLNHPLHVFAGFDAIDRAEGCNPLLCAARGPFDGPARLLFERSAQLEPKDPICDRTALSWAAQRGHGDLFRQLPGRSADANVRNKFCGQSPLPWAIQGGNETVLRLLLDKGAYIESLDDDFSLLLRLAQRGP